MIDPTAEAVPLRLLTAKEYNELAGIRAEVMYLILAWEGLGPSTDPPNRVAARRIYHTLTKQTGSDQYYLDETFMTNPNFLKISHMLLGPYGHTIYRAWKAQYGF